MSVKSVGRNTISGVVEGSLIPNSGLTKQVESYVSSGKVKGKNDMGDRLASQWSPQSFTQYASIIQPFGGSSSSVSWASEITFDITRGGNLSRGILKQVYLDIEVPVLYQNVGTPAVASHQDKMGWANGFMFVNSFTIEYNGKPVQKVFPLRQGSHLKHLTQTHRDDYRLTKNLHLLQNREEDRCAYNKSQSDAGKTSYTIRVLLPDSIINTINTPLYAFSGENSLRLIVQLNSINHLYNVLNGSGTTYAPESSLLDKPSKVVLTTHGDHFSERQFTEVVKSSIASVPKSFRLNMCDGRILVRLPVGTMNLSVNLNDHLSDASISHLFFHFVRVSDYNNANDATSAESIDANKANSLTDPKYWTKTRTGIDLVQYEMMDGDNHELIYNVPVNGEFNTTYIGRDQILNKSGSTMLTDVEGGTGMAVGSVDSALCPNDLYCFSFCDDIPSALEGYNSGSYVVRSHEKLSLNIKVQNALDGSGNSLRTEECYLVIFPYRFRVWDIDYTKGSMVENKI